MQPDPLVVARCAQERGSRAGTCPAHRRPPNEVRSGKCQRAQQLADFAASEDDGNTGRAKVASVMKTSHGTGSNGGQVDRAGACSRPRRRCAGPCAPARLGRARIWPAGTRLTSNVAHLDAVTIWQRLLAGVRHVLEAVAHDGQRLGRGERAPVARPGMVAMAVGDDGAGTATRGRHRNRRLTIEAARVG